MIVLDTPGLLNPAYPLQQAMHATAREALADADVVLYVADANEGLPPPLEAAASLSSPLKAPVLLALNKADTLSTHQREDLLRRAPAAHLISAVTGEGVGPLLAEVARFLPESPFLYPDDEISTQTVRFFVAELVRETALEQLEDEVPYSIACEVEEYREERKPLYIRAVLYVERESQKRIIIGTKGTRIRDIGRVARTKIERFLGQPVYLDLWVKVLPNWRKSATALRRFGYRTPTENPP